MKKLIGIMILTLILAQSVFADGFVVSDIHRHLNEPDQKAVISWDGYKETMMLSASFRSDEVANFAWVVPINSLTKPEISEGDMEVFYKLVDYFKPTRINIGPRVFAGKMEGSGVQVIETKEVDVYDITILKATDADDLMTWLSENGYKISEDMRPILQKYVAKGNSWFIANKIDLTNKHQNYIHALLYTKGLLPEMYTKDWDKLDTMSKMDRVMSYWQQLRHQIARDLQDKETYENSQASTLFAKNYGMTKERYESLMGKSYNEIWEGMFPKWEEYNNLREEMMKLKTGLATPLKFEFTPEKPYFPLEISSLNTGYTVIEVYVMTKEKVIDENSILKIDDSKWISSELKKELEKHMNIGNARYVTRLTFMGDVKQLQADAKFAGVAETNKDLEIKYTFLEKVFEWISGLFE